MAAVAMRMNPLSTQRVATGSTLSRNRSPNGKASEAAAAIGPTSRQRQFRKCGGRIGALAAVSMRNKSTIATIGS